MTSPAGGEYISRYRALGEFDNLIREANKARRAIRELREEEAKLNAQSLADDKKIAASKLDRAKAEQSNVEAAKKAISDLNRGNTANKTGEDAGVSYSRGVGKGIDKGTQSNENRRFLDQATNALKAAFAKAGQDSGKSYARNLGESIKKESTGSNTTFIDDAIKAMKAKLAKAGDESGERFVVGIRERFKKDGNGLYHSSGFEYSLREFADRANSAGEDTGNRYIMGFASKIKNLNKILPLLGQDKLDLDVDIKDAQQSIAALEIELNRLSHTTAEPRVRIDSTRALVELRAIKKLFKDEVAESLIKESKRIQEELKIVDSLPSGKAFKFWALTALSDMSKVFSEAGKGVSTFEKLRRTIAASGSGGGGNYFKTLISGFDDFSEASSKLLQRLGRISGELYRMPGIIGVLVSSIPALLAGLGALGGGALGVASALGSLSGFLAAAPGLGFALIGSVGAMSSSFGGLSDVLKEAQKAADAEAEAKEKSRLKTDKALTANQKYKLSLEQLDPSTRKVTESIVKFSESYGKLEKRVGEKFFKEVADQTGRLNKLLPIAENFFGKSAVSLGKLADEGIRMITSGPFKRDFGIIANSNATLISNMGKAGFSLVTAFKNIAVAAIPFTTWVTGSIKNAAKAFADWSAQARSDGTIQSFLNETKETGKILFQVFKNLGNIVNSFFTSTVDEGQTYLRTLEDITGHWADVAQAQESANSPLRTWMTQIRPILSSLGDLIHDLATGIGGLASNQSSIQSMVNLLDTLRTKVLPPILEILQHLNDSGIAVTVVNALGTLLKAISNFLDSGATTALTVFVTVLSKFAELIFSFVSLPVISDALGGLAAALAGLAAVSVVARFTGLFKLWDFFTWMIRNKGNLSGAFADAARGAAGLSQTGGQQALPARVPSSIGSIGSEVIGAQARQIDKVGEAAQRAAGRAGLFSRALTGIRSAGNTAKNALSGLTGFLGGPWGIALIGATVAIGAISNKLADNKREAEDTKNAFLALKGAYGELREGNTESINSLAETDEKLRQVISQAEKYGLSLTDVSGALNNQEQSLSRFNSQIDTQINALKSSREAINNDLELRGYAKGATNEQTQAIDAQIAVIEGYKNQVNSTATAQESQNKILQDATKVSRTYQQRLAGMTQAQVNNAVEAGELDNKIRTLSNALDILSSATATSKDRSRALSDIINSETGQMQAANEATETWSSTLFDFKDTVRASRGELGKHQDALGTNSRAGLRNRDALEAAAKAARNLYLEDIASGVPMDKATKKHQDRIKELKEEAKRLKLGKEETEKLIKAYGDVPEDVKTNIKSDNKGFEQVYADLAKLQIMQKALQEGKSVGEAQKSWNQESQKLYQRYIPGKNDGPGFKEGGPVWGAGTRTSDSIRAWLSNGEFVQPTDAVEHYGMPIMEALRTKKLDKAALNEALPDDNMVNFKSGGHAHSSECASCQSGGHKFAKGGTPTWPFVVDPRGTKIDKDWVNQGSLGGIGGGVGGGGYKWQMAVLRKQFPGLPLISGFRPGARTLSGNRSYHSVGRAVDLPPRRDVAAWIRANYGSRTKELITPYNDLNLHNGKPHRYTGAIWNQHNFAGGNAHDHWAFKQGGMVDLMKMIGMDNLAPQRQNLPLPSTPRTLSPAASSVVNNSTDNGTTFGDVIINNPMQERAGDSIRDSIYRTQLLI